MPIYVYWGEDDFAMEKAIVTLRERVLDPLWASFNYT
ncbi:MAG: DNA polymerase III subunit delta, partial [Dolichospermum sp.]